MSDTDQESRQGKPQEEQEEQIKGEYEGKADEAIAKQVDEDPLDEDSIEKAGEAARAAQKANLQAAKTQDPEERKRLLTEAANQNKTVQTLQSGALQGAAAGGGIGLATGAGLGTVVGTVVGGAASVPTTAVGAGVGAGVGAIRGPRYGADGQSQDDEEDGGDTRTEEQGDGESNKEDGHPDEQDEGESNKEG